MMFIRFWGVRGSIPTPLTPDQVKDKILKILRKSTGRKFSNQETMQDFLDELSPFELGTVGGNTSCVEIRPSISTDKVLILDMGSGIKNLGNSLVKEYQNGADIHIFLSHTHWDHIHGFPFFMPAYIPGNKISIYSPHKNLENRLNIQQDARFFPVSLNQMAAEKHFVEFEPGTSLSIEGITISNYKLNHPGDSFGYRIEENGRIVVYTTDSEFKSLHQSDVNEYLNFIDKADLLIFDSQYTFEEAFHKHDWGHSTAIAGIDLAERAGVKKLVLFHHEPEYSDSKLNDIYSKALDYQKISFPNSDLEVSLAFEGLEIKI